MGIRNFPSGLAPMNGEIPNLDLEAKRYGVNPAKIHTPPGDALQLSDCAAAHQGLEGIGGHVPTQTTQAKQQEKSSEQQIIAKPAPTRFDARLAHRNSVPDWGGPASVRIW